MNPVDLGQVASALQGPTFGPLQLPKLQALLGDVSDRLASVELASGAYSKAALRMLLSMPSVGGGSGGSSGGRAGGAGRVRRATAGSSSGSSSSSSVGRSSTIDSTNGVMAAAVLPPAVGTALSNGASHSSSHSDSDSSMLGGSSQHSNGTASAQVSEETATGLKELLAQQSLLMDGAQVSSEGV